MKSILKKLLMYVKDCKIKEFNNHVDDEKRVIRRDAGSTYPVSGINREDAIGLHENGVDSSEWIFLSVLLVGVGEWK